MGSRVRGLDWSCTPLGPPPQWPGHLQVAATLCLSSHQPAHLWWGPELTVLYNDACIPFLGRHPDGLGRPAREVWEDIWGHVEPLIGQVFHSSRPTWIEELPRPGQGRLSLHVSPVPGPTGTVAGVFCICHPTPGPPTWAAMQRADQELERLREADRQKDAFLATLAHELRNPLAPICNAVQIMRLCGTTDPELSRAQGIIERQTQQLVRLVEDLMEISRISRGRIQLQLQRMDLRDAITTAVEASRSLIDAAGHELVLKLPPAPLPVDGDPARLSQIFANLLNNAAKYTPEPGRIELSVQVTGPVIEVRVADTGVGIPREMLGRIFDMFAQVEPCGRHTQGGLGIGLTVAQQLARLHGGGIEAHSDGERRGSTFIVHLPLLQADPREAPPGAQTPDISLRRTTPRRVLIADDSADTAETLGVLLRMAGHTVHTVRDGLAAVQGIGEHAPDVVLLDIGMPGLSGYEAAERIRALPQGGRILLIALTGWGQDADRERAAQAGFDYHLTKPADPQLLERMLGDCGPE